MIKFRINKIQAISREVGGIYKEVMICKFKRVALYKAKFKLGEHSIQFLIISFS